MLHAKMKATSVKAGPFYRCYHAIVTKKLYTEWSLAILQSKPKLHRAGCQQLHTPTIPSLRPSTRYPSLIRTRSTALGLLPSDSRSAAFAPQSHCCPSARS